MTNLNDGSASAGLIFFTPKSRFSVLSRVEGYETSVSCPFPLEGNQSKTERLREWGTTSKRKELEIIIKYAF